MKAMQKSFASEKKIQKSSINPEDYPETLFTAKSIHQQQIHHSSPIPQSKNLPNTEKQHQKIHAESSNNLSIPDELKFNIQNYRFNQTYFTREELIEQQNYNLSFQDDFIYAGGIKNNLKHGLGILITKNTIYEGNLRNKIGQFSLNHKNGKGFMEYPNKSRYFGDFSNDKPHGNGMLQYGNEYYIGDFENGMMHGDGLWKNEKGQKYLGKWKTNKAHEYGIYVTENSHYQGTVSYMKGQFNTFEKHGYGVQNFANGDIYKGYYIHGKPHGYGEYFWQNKSCYKGNFVLGLREGEGCWSNQSGDLYQGFFKNDKKNGKGFFKWVNGNRYNGQFLEDLRHGNGTMMWNDGSTYEGEWSRGLPNGKGLYQAKGDKAKYGLFQDNVLIQELKSYSIPQRSNNTKSHHKKNSQIQKTKLYLNIIPQFPKKRNIPEFRSSNHRGSSLHKTAGSTMASFRVTGSKGNSFTWKNK